MSGLLSFTLEALLPYLTTLFFTISDMCVWVRVCLRVTERETALLGLVSWSRDIRPDRRREAENLRSGLRSVSIRLCRLLTPFIYLATPLQNISSLHYIFPLLLSHSSPFFLSKTPLGHFTTPEPRIYVTPPHTHTPPLHTLFY